MQQAKVIATLGDLGDAYRLHALCIHCRHTEQLDIPRLIARLGPAFLIRDVSGRLFCSACGERRPQMTLAPVLIGGWGGAHRH